MDEVNITKKYNENTKHSLYTLGEEDIENFQKKSIQVLYRCYMLVSKPNYVDGLHPNEKGQKEIAKAVWKGLKNFN